VNSIEVSELTKRFGELTAVDGASFSVRDGEFFGFLGPNGAGKTTLIRMLTTILKPTSGRASVAGFDLLEDPDGVRRSIGVVPQAMTSDLDLTGLENMEIYGRFYGMGGSRMRERIAHLLEIVGLTGRAKDLVATYSGGMRRRLEVVKALVHRPEILFLDEPTQGLDPQSRRTVWEFISAFGRGEKLTIFLTTHYMEEAEALCDRVAIIDHGRLIALDKPENLKAALPEHDTVILELPEVSEGIISALRGLDFVGEIKLDGRTVRMDVRDGAHRVPAILQRITGAGGAVTSVAVKERSLEDVFIHFTGRSIREEEAKKVSMLIGAGAPRKWMQR
jgi:ABC-2 type transport system ATP-binding protein